LTLCFLGAYDLVRIGDPHLFLRWHPGLDKRVKLRALEMLASGVSMPLLINDEPTAQGFMDTGMKPEDAWEYCVIGCNELGVPGRSAESATSTSGLIQHLELLNQTLLQHPDPTAIEDMSQLLGALEETMREHALAARKRAGWSRQRRIARVPTPLASALMRGCIARGKDMQEGMDYHLPGLYERGLTNAANALAAIDQVVFEERALSMQALVEAMTSDFEDCSVQSHLLAAPKWGNDHPRVDRWAQVLVEMRERVLDEVDAAFGHAPHVVCHVVRSLHYFDGQRIAASPDGRRAWTPVADSIGAQTGTARSGPTATLNSVLKLDAARYYRGGYNLNLTLSRRTTTVKPLAALVESFFSRGGQELQVNCFDVETLRAAQRCPEQYGDLVVRVAGFSTRFVDLSAVEQEELIARTESLQ
jgi:formate C-acetyltransferase